MNTKKPYDLFMTIYMSNIPDNYVFEVYGYCLEKDIKFVNSQQIEDIYKTFLKSEEKNE